ncbi:hypothetical protein FJ443_07600 [Mesorhizobium sp. B2-6-1]|nr:hypothetical protein FJ443_07600 [Mesorhizobium sp. B2-6-1]
MKIDMEYAWGRRSKECGEALHPHLPLAGLIYGGAALLMATLWIRESGRSGSGKAEGGRPDTTCAPSDTEESNKKPTAGRSTAAVRRNLVPVIASLR